MQPRIVITGAQVICAAGSTPEALAGGLSAELNIGRVKDFEFHSFDKEVPCYRVKDIDPVAILGKSGLRTKDWATKLLLCCVESGFGTWLQSLPEADRPGFCVGTAFGSVQSIGDFLSDSIVNGVNSVNPQAFANTVINSPTSNVNIRHTLRALSATISTGFTSSLDALLYAADQLRNGYLSRILAGGTEEVSYYELLGLQRSGALSRAGEIKPFGADADGYVMGEGCGMLLLESEAAAQARGATILAEVAGIASAFDPGRVKQTGELDRDVMRHVIQEACAQAGIGPGQLSFVAVNANGNPNIDKAESAILSELCPDVPVTAYKRSIGECYGASQAIMAVLALTDMRHQRISGAAGAYPLVPGAALVRETLQNRSSEYVCINGFSCDGQCGAIILRNRQ
jgi:3-oxoacyl-(acyl-carrier-protein) synthase